MLVSNLSPSSSGFALLLTNAKKYERFDVWNENITIKYTHDCIDAASRERSPVLRNSAANRKVSSSVTITAKKRTVFKDVFFKYNWK